MAATRRGDRLDPRGPAGPHQRVGQIDADHHDVVRDRCNGRHPEAPVGVQGAGHDHSHSVEDDLGREQPQESGPQIDLLRAQTLVGDTHGKEAHDDRCAEEQQQ